MQDNSNTTSIQFTARGLDLLGLWLSNTLLSVITLGIYSFWAKIRITKFFHEHTWFQSHNLQFHATGAERGRGFAKALGIFALAGLVLFLNQELLTNVIGEEASTILTAVLFSLVFVALTPIIAIGKRRYLMSRTSWRNVRFRFQGSIIELSKINVLGTLFSILTLGLYLPFYQVKRQAFYINNTFYGSEPFQYSGDGLELLKLSLKGIALSIITLGVYGFWYRAQVYNYHWKQTQFQGHAFDARLDGLTLLILSAVSIPLVILTLGLGIPFVLIMRKRAMLESISYGASIDLARISGEVDKGANALADGLSDAGDALDVLGDVFS